jgi:maleylacetoacetate isomerase
MLDLFSYFRSSAAYRVRIVLNLKGIEYAIRPVNLLNGGQRDSEYLAKNPQGRVPMLIDGDTVIHQSTAIIEYLEERYREPAVYPSTPADRALARGLTNVVACDIHPLNNLSVLRYIKNQFGQDQGSIDRWYRHWIREGFAAIESRLGERGEAPFVFGNSPGIVEAYLVPQIYNARRFETPMVDFPTLAALDQACSTIPAFIDAAPENQADAPTT